jgi:predicted SnoaL-like aldol condensation-catalyzing enzyme
MIALWKAVLVAGAVAQVQGVALLSGETLNPRTVPQVAPMTPQEKKNLDTVLAWWREVVYAGHVEKAARYMADDVIEHSPNISTGRAGFVAYVSKMNKPVSPIPAQLDEPPAVMAAKGDYVWFLIEKKETDARDASRTYYSDVMQLVRLENGKIREHWDSVRKMPGTGRMTPGVSTKPAMEWNTGTLSQDEEQTLLVATTEFKDILQNAHMELAANFLHPDYLQHNANFPQGREALIRVMRQRPGRRAGEEKPIKAAWPDPPFLTLVNGPYSMMVWERTSKDPDDPARDYKWYHYDMVRVENGLVREHWDEFLLNPPPMAVSKQ